VLLTSWALRRMSNIDMPASDTPVSDTPPVSGWRRAPRALALAALLLWLAVACCGRLIGFLNDVPDEHELVRQPPRRLDPRSTNLAAPSPPPRSSWRYPHHTNPRRAGTTHTRHGRR